MVHLDAGYDSGKTCDLLTTLGHDWQISTKGKPLQVGARQTPERLNFFLAWTQAESQQVGKAYDELIMQVRRKTGLAMKAAWEEPVTFVKGQFILHA